jgi:ectoine hydroxylase-related dioxygenase (phytanoyl-CoA dioxygenase family)
MLGAIAAPDPPVAARGRLADLYSKGSERLHQLRDKGYVHIKGAVSPEDVAMLRDGFDAAIAVGGFPGRFADPRTIQRPEDLPYHFWGLDPVYLPFCDAAMQARGILRAVFAAELKVDPESLLSSFDAVMATHPGYQTQPAFDPARPRVPMKLKDGRPGGPGHVDQRPDNSSIADAQQCFLALTDAEAKDMSTVVLAPCGEWTAQGMMDKAREQFPEAFKPTKKNPGDNGMMFAPHVQEWLVAKGIAKAVKPRMAPGDVLIWSSAIPHCAGAAKPPRGIKRRARLGIIAGFYPADMVSEAAKEERRKIVGEHQATGQQVHEPGRHMPWPQAFRWMKADAWPPTYKRIKKVREEVRTGKRPRIYKDVEGDADAERATKKLFRSLLG